MSDSTSPAPGSQAPDTASVAAAEVAADEAAVASAFERKTYAVATHRGFGNAMGRGFELAMTLLVMVGLGLGADAVFDTRPLFVIVFSVLGFAGISVKLWLGYDQEMRREEEGAIWNRHKEQAA